MRSQGPFAEGDRVQLTDSKSRHITLTLEIRIKNSEMMKLEQ